MNTFWFMRGSSPWPGGRTPLKNAASNGSIPFGPQPVDLSLFTRAQSTGRPQHELQPPVGTRSRRASPIIRRAPCGRVAALRR